MSRSSRKTAARAVPCVVCGGANAYLFSKLDHDVFRCRVCGLGSVRPLRAPARLEELYASAYYASDHPWGYRTEYGELEEGLRRTYRRFLRRVERRFPGRRFDRVLDVGCAYGFFLDTVEERWHPLEATGVDLAPEARQRNREKGRTFHAGFFEEVELPEAHFDFVFLGDTFEHIHDPLAVVGKLGRIVAPGGVVLVTTVDFGSCLARLLGSRWRLMTPPEHLYFWTRASLVKVFTDRGFSGGAGNYWLFYPGSYVYRTVKAQFGFAPPFLRWMPVRLVPVFSFDVLMGIFQKRAR